MHPRDTGNPVKEQGFILPRLPTHLGCKSEKHTEEANISNAESLFTATYFYKSLNIEITLISPCKYCCNLIYYPYFHMAKYNFYETLFKTKHVIGEIRCAKMRRGKIFALQVFSPGLCCGVMDKVTAYNTSIP